QHGGHYSRSRLRIKGASGLWHCSPRRENARRRLALGSAPGAGGRGTPRTASHAGPSPGKERGGMRQGERHAGCLARRRRRRRAASPSSDSAVAPSIRLEGSGVLTPPLTPSTVILALIAAGLVEPGTGSPN